MTQSTLIRSIVIIKFAVELKKERCLPFLDTLVVRNTDKKLKFDVYRKKTSTSRYIPFDSHHCIHNTKW